MFIIIVSLLPKEIPYSSLTGEEEGIVMDSLPLALVLLFFPLHPTVLFNFDVVFCL